jgi:quercetin dioxygenase-like cupin family protein
MSKMRRKLISAGVFVGGALGLFALKAATATPAAGLSTSFVASQMVLAEVDVHTEKTDGHQVKIKTKGVSDVYVVRNILVPGGHTGWHSHPGPSIISVVAGVATEYHGDDPAGVVHPAGTAFVDYGDHAHLIRNEGNTNLELVAFQILPAGATRRIDEPAP